MLGIRVVRAATAGFLVAIPLFPSLAVAASTQSQSAIGSCFMEPFTLTSRSEVVNGNPNMHRAKVSGSHYEFKSNVWELIDFQGSGWGGLVMTVAHGHSTSNLFNDPDTLRVISTHIYQRCTEGFWEDWRDLTTARTGCGNETVIQ